MKEKNRCVICDKELSDENACFCSEDCKNAAAELTQHFYDEGCIDGAKYND